MDECQAPSNNQEPSLEAEMEKIRRIESVLQNPSLHFEVKKGLREELAFHRKRMAAFNQPE